MIVSQMVFSPVLSAIAIGFLFAIVFLTGVIIGVVGRNQKKNKR